MYDHPSQFEPLLITESSQSYRLLIGLAQELTEIDARLDSAIHKESARALSDLVRAMNCYYSNLIEGHHTLPAEIDRAMHQNFSGSPKESELQMLAFAHIKTTEWATSINIDEHGIQKFILDAHKIFCDALPDSMLILEMADTGKIVRMVPGEIRANEVQVGQHVAPTFTSVEGFLGRYESVYSPVIAKAKKGGLEKLEAIVVSMLAHHRLAWIHPFPDGNGRIARIVLDAMLKDSGVAGAALWSMSRGFAKSQREYKLHLADADKLRMGDLDGRGNLSEAMLAAFCEYGLRTAIDQVKFMSNMLALDTIEQRVIHYFKNMRTDLRPESHLLYLEALARGGFERGEAPRITGLAERTARDVLSNLIKEGFLLSDTPKGRVRTGFPVKALGTFLPNLYPAGDLDFATPG
jgi:Fic family protein